MTSNDQMYDIKLLHLSSIHIKITTSDNSHNVKAAQPKSINGKWNDCRILVKIKLLVCARKLDDSCVRLTHAFVAVHILDFSWNQNAIQQEANFSKELWPKGVCWIRFQTCCLEPRLDINVNLLLIISPIILNFWNSFYIFVWVVSNCWSKL